MPSATRRLAQLIAVGRIGIGCTALAAPTVMTRPWIGDGAGTADARLLARTMGGRDLALGLGTLRALAVDDGEARPWVALAGMADAVDAGVTLAAFPPPTPADPVGHPGGDPRGRGGLVPGGRRPRPGRSPDRCHRRRSTLSAGDTRRRWPRARESGRVPR